MSDLVERLKRSAAPRMEYFSQGGMNLARETRGDPLHLEAASEIRRLSARVEELEAERGWRPISEAKPSSAMWLDMPANRAVRLATHDWFIELHTPPPTDAEGGTLLSPDGAAGQETPK